MANGMNRARALSPVCPKTRYSHARIFVFSFYIGSRCCRFWLILAALLLAPMALAQAPGTTRYVTASIEAETAAPAPGSTVSVAIVMNPKPGWHDYWLNPGDAGTPLELDWKLPAGVTAGPIRAPVPETLIVSGFMNHIYKARHAFLVDLNIASTVAQGQRFSITVDARWSACSDTVCVPEGGTLSVPMTIGDGTIDRASRARFDGWRAALPAPLDREARYAIGGKRIDIAIPFPRGTKLGQVWFFPQTEGLFRYAAPQSARRVGDWLVITGAVDKAFDGRIDGLLRFNDAQGLEVRATPGAIPTGGDAVSVLGRAGEAQQGVTFGWILGFSVLGGLLLNLMPCVFPILGLKALSLAKMGGDERAARVDALAYSGGVILSCLALGGLLLVLRAGGEEIGWAFQLQEPVFVFALLLLMVAVTANLAGMFEIGAVDAGGSLTRREGAVGSFWTGVLAALVATPCTGPFMAAALGAALLLPVAQALALLAGLGLGLALPFLVLAYVPAFRRLLPRPGPWLGTFRRAMAVPMGLTALALLWLLWRLMGGAGLIVGGIAAVALLIGLWIMVREKGKAEVARGRHVLALGSVLLAMGVIALDRLPEPAAAATPDLLDSEVFTQARLDAYRAEGRNVFLYFTADWCVTCKVNEAAAINRAETKAAFEKAGIVTLKGDFTRRDPAIARFLAKHGRSGVPLYLYFPKGGEPQVLPQILTVEMLKGLAK
jgi:DsbC/DsbD-like thiol-disulfide interchange protein/cytochrome c biogenesis protein CcdA